jgi:hypothetical protein
VENTFFLPFSGTAAVAGLTYNVSALTHDFAFYMIP